MADYGAQVADKAISYLTRQVRKVYEQAAKELQEKLNSFVKRFQAADLKKQALLKAGEITKADYDLWMSGQVFQRMQWQRRVHQAARIMNNANNTAKEIVQKGRFSVFAENYNYAAFQTEKYFGLNLNFNLFSSDTVSRLIKSAPKLLPEWKIDKAKDYIWNYQKIKNSILQSIIQGEGVEKAVKRLISDLITQNWNRMRTFVRTAITGAQNAGRQKQMEDAEKEGVKGKKHWLATLDDRTRDTHQELDGQEVPIREPFKVKVKGKIEKIMCPGDPNALPCLVYNCRCTMFEVYDGIERTSIRRDMDGNMIKNMNYKQWKEWKEGQDDGQSKGKRGGNE